MPSKRPVLRQQWRKAATRAAWAQVVAAELLDELDVGADDAATALDPGLARGNPRRRLLVGSKGRSGVVVDVVHGRPPWCGGEQLDGSQRGAASASHFTHRPASDGVRCAACGRCALLSAEVARLIRAGCPRRASALMARALAPRPLSFPGQRAGPAAESPGGGFPARNQRRPYRAG